MLNVCVSLNADNNVIVIQIGNLVETFSLEEMISLYMEAKRVNSNIV